MVCKTDTEFMRNCCCFIALYAFLSPSSRFSVKYTIVHVRSFVMLSISVVGFFVDISFFFSATAPHSWILYDENWLKRDFVRWYFCVKIAFL